MTSQLVEKRGENFCLVFRREMADDTTLYGFKSPGPVDLRINEFARVAIVELSIAQLAIMKMANPSWKRASRLIDRNQGRKIPFLGHPFWHAIDINARALPLVPQHHHPAPGQPLRRGPCF
jgi:hypothetical protein